MFLKVLLTPGSYYHPWEGKAKTTTKAKGYEAGIAHFRFSFALNTVCVSKILSMCKGLTSITEGRHGEGN